MIFVPLGTSRPCWRRPYATYILLLLNLAAYIAEYLGADLTAWYFVPAEASLINLFTAMFVHNGFLHLFFNMLFLWIFGSIAEDVLGAWIFLGFYIVGGMGAAGLDTVVSALFVPDALNIPLLGASGAIAGIMGLSVVCFSAMRIRVWYFVYYIAILRTGVVEVPAIVFLGIWAGWEVLQGLLATYLQSAMGFLGGVAHWAHVGGFSIGLLGAVVFGLRSRVVRGDLVLGRRPVTDSLEAMSQVTELEKVVKTAPEDAEALYALGRAWEIHGKAKDARISYEKAMCIFLKQRRTKEAVKVYRALAAYDIFASCPEGLQFELALALEKEKMGKQAYNLLREIAVFYQGEERGETALFRAAEIARTSLKDEQAAVECYRQLLEDYPHGHCRNLCLGRMRQLGLE